MEAYVAHQHSTILFFGIAIPVCMSAQLLIHLASTVSVRIITMVIVANFNAKESH